MTTARKRIYIVDDHALVREWLANLLRQEPDFEISGQAESSSVALSEMMGAVPDVAIVDLSLKSGSGLDLIKDLRVQCPTALVVVLSMHEEIYFIERALRAGARAYVTKSESTNRIVEAIRAVLAGNVYANNATLAQLAERIVGLSADKNASSIEQLSDREMEVFRRLGEGQTSRVIAAEMAVSIKTVQAYCARIKDKLRLTNISELMREAVRWAESRKRS